MWDGGSTKFDKIQHNFKHASNNNANGTAKSKKNEWLGDRGRGGRNTQQPSTSQLTYPNLPSKNLKLNLGSNFILTSHIVKDHRIEFKIFTTCE